MSKAFTISWADMEDEEEDRLNNNIFIEHSISYAVAAGGTCFNEPIEDYEPAVQEIIDSIVEDGFIEVKPRKKSKSVKSTVSKFMDLVDEKSFKQTITWGTELTCKECNDQFVFSNTAKKRYSDLGWQPPRMCKPCTQNRYHARNATKMGENK